ncbi:DNA-binding transcriptional regulator, LysR family [Burkholderiales bacterium 8X]|nr:DNA-binding transcriptional regulator, LysR family [Burkholderiales bacterium 8X]
MRQLRAFATIARVGSFTRAAEHLHLTQPGLSGMLREMEQQLDCRLFERTTRSVALTPQGRAFLPVVTRVLSELESAAATLGNLSSVERRRLVVGATPVMASSVLPEACQVFARAHPGVQVEVRDLDRSQIHAGVQGGELDGFGVFLDAASGLKRRPLLATSLVLVTQPGEPASAMRWSDLKGAVLLALPPTNPIQRLIDSQLRDAGVTAEVRQVFTQLHTVLAMVESGAGQAVLPSFVSAAALRYQVALRPLLRPKVRLDFFEITRSGAPRSPLLAGFGRCLVETLNRRENAALRHG